MKRDGVDYIWQYLKPDSGGVPLTDGLEEILFNNASNMNLIKTDDVENWKYLIKSAGLSSVYHSSGIGKKLLLADVFVPKTPKATRAPESRGPSQASRKPSVVEGEGLHSNIITIPTSPDALREQLILQMSALKAGHRGTFNHANALMKELMKQKKMSSKEYRDILKNIYHV